MRGVPQRLSVAQPAQPTMKTRSKDISRSDLPQDLGLLPGTFIRPLWRDMPSIFQQPRERLAIEWLSVKVAFQNFLGLIYYCKTGERGLPLNLKERRLIGRELHQRMYNAFARGDIFSLRKICCTGLANSLSSQIERRARNERVTWDLQKYIRGPATFFTGIRVVSDRATQIPELEDSGVRQVILRITSRQSTSKYTVPSKREAENSTPTLKSAPVIKDCTEYIVIQKLRWAGEEGEWRIWGHATPSTVEDLESPMFSTKLSLYERLMALKDEVEGGRR
ncbi:hypothetical protein MPDQ_002194 [Monascus purpureus]|uniref:Tim44-like domain-containing protein n=1 Tax=Monascus purpureus TaxID=5098 RepID=A0A507QKX4_MONPU|nr:hypothetical protein MPDQ_002194 [Monascus purpureus]